MEISPLGDSALLIRVVEDFHAAPDEALAKVVRAQRVIESAQIGGVIELAPAYGTLAVFYDPALTVDSDAENPFAWLEQQITRALTRDENVADDLRSRPIVDVPVCYEQEFALDLEHVARHANLHSKEVVDLHCSVQYRVQCVGFTPGFPYLGGLPRQLATPRKDAPRKEVPSGAVAIGGSQTGIYPVKSPGGWNVIGRTPLRLFDSQKDPPAFLQAGDRVRFREITREEFERLTS